MDASESVVAFAATAKRGNSLHPGASDCAGIHARVARVLWPRKTAAHWASRAGVKERMAKYWLAQKHPVSASGRLAIIRELG